MNNNIEDKVLEISDRLDSFKKKYNTDIYNINDDNIDVDFIRKFKLEIIEAINDNTPLIWMGKLLGGNSLNLDMTGYKKIIAQVKSYSSGYYVTIPLDAIGKEETTGYPYDGGGACGGYDSGNNVSELHTSNVKINTNKDIFMFAKIGYWVGATFSSRNANQEYYINNIWGCL